MTATALSFRQRSLSNTKNDVNELQPKSYDNAAYEDIVPQKDSQAPIPLSTISNSINGLPQRYAESDADELENGSPRKRGAFMAAVEKVQTSVYSCLSKNKKPLMLGVKMIVLLLYIAYFGYAMYYSRLQTEDDIRLLWITCFVVLVAILCQVLPYMKSKLTRLCNWVEEKSKRISWTFALILHAFFIVFVLIDNLYISLKPENLWSFLGIITYLTVLFIFSHSPSQVRWRPVMWGLAIQMTMALVILRWPPGFQAFKWLGDRVAEFLAHTDEGSKFVFNDIEVHFFAFKVLPVVIFFSAMVSVLFYLGAMQVVIRAVASFLQTLMGTTAAESVNAAANIFIGMTEAPLIISPFLKDMTKSEIHSITTSGFATIAGSVMAAYILLGVEANHLISASVMSAPAALAASKLFYPETEIITPDEMERKSKQSMEKSKERNIIEAASAGASAAISLAANIAANLIAFIAALHFLNATLCWFGDRVGVDHMSFELVLSYILYPFAFVMGVDTMDCKQVAELIGVKTMLNEFVAYERLSVLIANGKIGNEWELCTGNSSLVEHLSNSSVILHGSCFYDSIANITEVNRDAMVSYFFPKERNIPTGSFSLVGPSLLKSGIITDRSEVISTYALCGFANFGSIGITLGGLGALCPERKSDVAQVVLRAMIAGNIACFMTASIAGLLYQRGT